MIPKTCPHLLTPLSPLRTSQKQAEADPCHVSSSSRANGGHQDGARLAVLQLVVDEGAAHSFPFTLSL
jgi:hypothetical protein